MGGLGSGRYGARRPITEQYRKIDLSRLEFLRKVEPNTTVRISGEQAVVAYIVGGERYRAHLAMRLTPTSFGGHRHWFVCPGCNRGCRVVYIAPALRCRHCLSLGYASQRVNAWQSKLWRADALRYRIGERLGQHFQDGEAFPARPYRMRRRTYRRLQEKYDKAQARWAVGMLRLVGVHPSKGA